MCLRRWEKKTLVRSEAGKMCKLDAEETHFDADHGSLPVCGGDSSSSAGGTDDKLIFFMYGADSIVFRLQRVERDREESSPLGHGGRGDGRKSDERRGGLRRRMRRWKGVCILDRSATDKLRWHEEMFNGRDIFSSGVCLPGLDVEHPFIRSLTRRKWRRVTSRC